MDEILGRLLGGEPMDRVCGEDLLAGTGSRYGRGCLGKAGKLRLILKYNS